MSNISTLKDESTWFVDAEQQANCFVKCFKSKNVMIEEEVNEYLKIDVAHAVFYSDLPSIEATAQALKQLDEDSALRPDIVPTRILKHCVNVLAPAAYVNRRHLQFRRMACAAVTHWIIQFYKRNSVHGFKLYSLIRIYR